MMVRLVWTQEIWSLGRSINGSIITGLLQSWGEIPKIHWNDRDYVTRHQTQSFVLEEPTGQWNQHEAVEICIVRECMNLWPSALCPALPSEENSSVGRCKVEKPVTLVMTEGTRNWCPGQKQLWILVKEVNYQRSDLVPKSTLCVGRW